MQTRPYDEKTGNRVWLNEDEQNLLVKDVEEKPKRSIAFSLGLHGLRSNEVTAVCPNHIRQITEDCHTLVIPDGKTGKREVPISSDLSSRIRMVTNILNVDRDEPIIDVSTRSLRRWIEHQRDILDCPDLGMHDLRRTWATDTFYSLSMDQNPIAEELTMSWGGWKMNENGRDVFRQNYLGPVPDKIVVQSMENGL